MTDDTIPELTLDEQLLLEQALLPPPGSLDLQRTPENDYRQRLRWKPLQAADLFVENSKITRAGGHNTAIDEQRLEQVRRWYFATAYQPAEGDFDDREAARLGVRVPRADLPEPLRRLLGGLLDDAATAGLLYGLDLFVLLGGASFRVFPSNPWLWLDRRFSPEEGAELSAAILGVPPAVVGGASALLAVVVAPPRYAVLQGSRGYRRTLVDLGRLLERCEAGARRAGVGVTIALDFHDVEVDGLLRLDGVERSTHALCLLSLGPGPAQEGTP